MIQSHGSGYSVSMAVVIGVATWVCSSMCVRARKDKVTSVGVMGQRRR